MRHTMFQEHRTFGFELDFVIYGHGSHLDHVSETILTKFTFPLSKRAPHKVWPSGFEKSCLKIIIIHMYIARVIHVIKGFFYNIIFC